MIKFNIKIPILIFILELIFSFLVFNNFNFFVMKLIIACILGLLVSLIKSNTIQNIICFLITLIFVYSYIYYIMYGNILTIGIILNSGKSFQFIGIIIDLLKNYFFYILLFLLPCLLVLIKKQFNLSIKEYCIILSLLIISNIVIVSTSNKNDIYSYYNLLFNIDNKIENVSKYGVLETKAINLFRYVFNFKEKNITELIKNNNTYSNDTYNITNLSFDNDEISNYLKNRIPTNKNDYTGILKNKNLIFVLAESFSELGLSEKYTPTLYELYNDSIRFNNYYSPLYPVSTSDTEYMFDYSLLPSENTWSIQRVNQNTNMYSLAEQLKNNGYNTYSFHNFDSNYYQRETYMPNLGFDSFLGCGNGLEDMINCDITYPSDKELFKNTIDTYLNDDKFFTYYITYSGHGNYRQNQNIALKNLYLVDEDNTSTVNEYIAANIELEKGIKILINKLEESNKLDDTVIVIIPDHYPYALTLNEYNDALNTNKDKIFEVNHMPLIIYNKDLEKTTINKKCSSIDILPTLLNMFGVEYDSRLLIGDDIMSDSDELVIFSNRSFLTNNGYYNSLTNETNLSTKEIKKYKEQILNEYIYSNLILETNYYKKIK